MKIVHEIIKKTVSMACIVGIIAGNVNLVMPVKAEAVAETIVAFNYSGNGKTAEADLDEYTDGADTYTYVATSGSGSLKTTITGTQDKHIAWSKDEYTLPDGSVSIVPAVSASKTNKWTVDARAYYMVSTEGYENLTMTIELGATKKGPKNLEIYGKVGSKKVEIGKFTIEDNKVMTACSFSLGEEFDNAKELEISVGLADIETVNGNLLAAKPESGEFALNNFVLTGTKIVNEKSTQTATKENASKDDKSSNKNQKESQNVTETTGDIVNETGIVTNETEAISDQNQTISKEKNSAKAERDKAKDESRKKEKVSETPDNDHGDEKSDIRKKLKVSLTDVSMVNSYEIKVITGDKSDATIRVNNPGNSQSKVNLIRAIKGIFNIRHVRYQDGKALFGDWTRVRF